MKNSVTNPCPEFNMHSMVMQYVEGYYLVVYRRHQLLHTEHPTRAKDFADGGVALSWRDHESESNRFRRKTQK